MTPTARADVREDYAADVLRDVLEEREVELRALESVKRFADSKYNTQRTMAREDIASLRAAIAALNSAPESECEGIVRDFAGLSWAYLTAPEHDGFQLIREEYAEALSALSDRCVGFVLASTPPVDGESE